MSEPEIGGRQPLPLRVEAGETCGAAAGRCKSQPFCDGAHEGTPFEPMEWTANRTGLFNFCTCKRTARPPICHNTHLRL